MHVSRDSPRQRARVELVFAGMSPSLNVFIYFLKLPLRTPRFPPFSTDDFRGSCDLGLPSICRKGERNPTELWPHSHGHRLHGKPIPRWLRQVFSDGSPTGNPSTARPLRETDPQTVAHFFLSLHCRTIAEAASRLPRWLSAVYLWCSAAPTNLT